MEIIGNDNEFAAKELAAIKIEINEREYQKAECKLFKPLFEWDSLPANQKVRPKSGKPKSQCGVSAIIMVFHGMPVMHLMMNSKKF